MRNSITIFIASIIVAAAQPVYAQSGGQAMPFVLLDADARTAGMAEAGGILPDNPSAVRHNAAAVLAGEHKAGLDLAAGPWNTDFDMSEVLYAASGYWNIDGRNGILAGVRCISGEDIVLTDEWGYYVGTAHPYDFAIEAGYARGFGEHFSVALTVMYMQSDLGIGEGPMRGVSFDAAGVYRHSAGFLDSQKSEGYSNSKMGSKNNDLKKYSILHLLVTVVILAVATVLQFCPTRKTEFLEGDLSISHTCGNSVR